MSVAKNLREALSFAARNIPVFPLLLTWNDQEKKFDKRPLVKWRDEATTDTATIHQWAKQGKLDCGYGIPAGEPSGIFCLDVDGEEGTATLAALEAEYGELPLTPKIRTISGGLHLYFKYNQALADVKNAVKFRPGLDIRNTGGLFARGHTKAGKGYICENPGTPLAEVPDWIIKLLTTKKAPDRAISAPKKTFTGEMSVYAESALNGECEAVAAASKGTRDDTLNKAAFSLGQLVAGGELDQGFVESRLMDAALTCGLTEAEARKAIESGLPAGMKNPRTAPVIRQAGQCPMPASPEAMQPLVAVSIAEFVTMDIQPREWLLSPILPRQGLVMIHGARGDGKTYLALTIALALASGSGCLGRWEAQRPCSVLYVDGEMPGHDMQYRIKNLVAGLSGDITRPDGLTLLTGDLQPDWQMPNLSTQAGQNALEPLIEDRDVVILDNLATLCSFGRANDEESWKPIQTWLLNLRRRGKSVIVLHHQNKGGEQRGTGAKEDVLDAVIALRRPPDYNPADGARFHVRFTKARGLVGDATRPFEAKLVAHGAGLIWTTCDIREALLEQVKEMLSFKMSIRDIAQELGMSASAVHRLKKKIEGGAE